jgi:Outer membrane protein beta-barrel domain
MSRRLWLCLFFVIGWNCCALGKVTQAIENTLRAQPTVARPAKSTQSNQKKTASVLRERSALRAAAYEESLPLELHGAQGSEIAHDPPPFYPEAMPPESISSHELPPEAFGQIHRSPSACEPTPLEILWLHRFKHAFQGYRDPNDPSRHFGIGEPLVGTSWRNRPWYVSGFAGGLIGDDLQSSQVDQGGGFLAGGRFGGDFDHFWGAEIRLAFANVNVDYPGVTTAGQSRDSFFDANLLYYPLGDTRWRPYLLVGFGMASYNFENAVGAKSRGTAVEIPFGGGLKYYLGRNWAMRFDLIDNFSLASGDKIDLMHNLSFTGGLEFHFGGKYVDYGPW